MGTLVIHQKRESESKRERERGTSTWLYVSYNSKYRPTYNNVTMLTACECVTVCINYIHM